MKILETIVTTRNKDGSTHIAPMGIWDEQNQLVLAPFNPSTTLENLRREPYAIINRVDDARIFAGCLSGHKQWPLCKADQLDIDRLEAALSHSEIEVIKIIDDDLRPQCKCKVIHEATHAPFKGFNRAQSAIIELAILVSRLDRLPIKKITSEINYLQIAIDKTAGAHELEAWSWLMDKVEKHLYD